LRKTFGGEKQEFLRSTNGLGILAEFGCTMGDDMTREAQLFVTCLADTFFPQVGEAVVGVLTRLGVSVEFPSEQTCCGQPNFNAGLRSQVRAMAEHMIRVFESTSGEVVTPSGSCASMLRYNYLELFADDPTWLPRAKSLAARTYEFSQYLVDVLGVSDVGARWDGKLTYHPSCHLLRALGVDDQPRTLLSAVQGAELVELPEAEDCCGFGGVFSVTQPELSTEMLHRKIDNLQASGAPTLVLGDTGCLMHVQGGLQRQKKTLRVVHIAEVLNNR
jgi:L-lactate dehydrogenase complex protein LldE